MAWSKAERRKQERVRLSPLTGRQASAETGCLTLFSFPQGKWKEYKNEVSISYKLNVEMPVFLDNLRDDERQVISRVDGLRKQRNKVAHGAKFVSDAEAKEAVAGAGALFDMLIARGIAV